MHLPLPKTLNRFHSLPRGGFHWFPSKSISKPGFIYRVSNFRPRTREVDLLDGFLNAHNLRSMIGIYHQSSVSSISVSCSKHPIKFFCITNKFKHIKVCGHSEAKIKKSSPIDKKRKDNHTRRQITDIRTKEKNR